jgi:deoxyribodipyrimidine photo-lyase
MASEPIIVWFRRDLRVADNPALLHAVSQGVPVVPLYIDGWEDGHPWAPGMAGRWWLRGSLRCLSDSLASLGAPLRVVTGSPEEEIARLAGEIGAAAVVWNRLYEPFSRELEGRVTAVLQREGVRWRTFNAALLFEPDGRYSRSGRPFVQFTSFWRSCLSSPEPPLPEAVVRELRGSEDLAGGVSARPGARVDESLRSRAVQGRPSAEEKSEWRPQYRGTQPWEPGEAGAHARLEQFLEDWLRDYGRSRDFPALAATSRLSPHLHFGELGPRQVWHAIRELGGTPGSGRKPAGAPGPELFLRQLGWREFGHYLLFHFPRMGEEPFRPEFSEFPWEDDPHGLEAWKWGETGYPLVDAGMRQLLAEGWMNNRLRMVTASFLTKDLLIPWRQGETWFWDRLVDADLANNSLGWQWTAGSGPDSAPYFRVFNPALQARRFDPDGRYVTMWEAPADGGREHLGEIRPIVDHDTARLRALAAFRAMRRSSASWPRSRSRSDRPGSSVPLRSGPEV